MNNTLSPTPSVPRSRGNDKRLAQAELPDELNSWVGEFDRHKVEIERQSCSLVRAKGGRII
jgi:hypothetical protein